MEEIDSILNLFVICLIQNIEIVDLEALIDGMVFIIVVEAVADCMRCFVGIAVARSFDGISFVSSLPDSS